MKQTEPTGIIGKATVDGKPVLYKLDTQEVPLEIKQGLPWLTVISWEYDGSDNNGMPPQEINDHMITLEDTLRKEVESNKVCVHVISKTGNNLKELIYYISSQDLFLEKLNKALAAHDRYPISIDFYNDPKWEEMTNTQALFKK